MKIDIHVHASERSDCSRAGEHEMIAEAIRIGLDAIAFTDHDVLVPLDHLAELNKQYAPFRIFGATEVRIDVPGGYEDILVYGINDPELEQRKWDYPELHRFVKERGGAQVLAHPFRQRDTLGAMFAQLPPDGVEIHSINIPMSSEDKITRWAEPLGCDLFHSSDAHNIEQLAAYYIELQRTPDTELELADILRHGAFKCRVSVDRVVALNMLRAEYELAPV
jgi:predicted metal-dependent phosphoesterase TrpH